MTSTDAPRLADVFARPLTDLRVSVTDRCNFRCRYCMPREIFGPDHAFLEREELLSFEEITRLVRLFTDVGVTKVRLTGGEPLLRSDLPALVAGLAEVEGVGDLALTTNGTLLPRHADALADAGLGRVTVSLDALDDEVHKAISDTRVPVTAVLAGIDAARAAGLPVKVNTVLKRGVNDHEITAMADWGRREGVTVRFIEYMDVGATNGWRLDDVVPAAEVVQRLGEVGDLEPVGNGTPGGDVGPVQTEPGQVAERLRWADGSGEVGVIASVTRPFCRTCSRARLSSIGELFTCLFASSGVDLRGPLRDGASDNDLAATIADTWQRRTDRYSEERTAETARDDRVEMSYIGG